MNVDSKSEEVNPSVSQEAENGEKAFPTIKNESEKSDKSTWWPNCTHPRYTKLAQRKFRDRIVILWKCRKCPRRVTEVIDIDMNSRNVFVKSTKAALPQYFDKQGER